MKPEKKASKDDVSGAMLDPSIFNSNTVRALAITATVFALAATSTSFLPGRIVSFLHLTAWAVFVGTNVWNTFFVGLTLFKLVPRQVFGRIQSKLFPRYFFMTSCAVLTLLGTLLFSPSSTPAWVLPALGLGAACSLANWLVVGPICIKYMFERYEIENKEEKSAADTKRVQELQKVFGKWHGISSLLNLVVLVAGVAHGWHLTGAFVSA